MTPPKTRDTIHVVRGTSAAGGVLQSGVAERSALMIQPDILSVGRLERYPSPEDWDTRRDAQWRKLLGDIGEDLPEPGLDDRLVRVDLLKNWEQFASAKEIVLWAGCEVADQWFLASAVYLADLLEYDVTRISVVQFVDHPSGHGLVRGVGELNPDQIREGFQRVRLPRGRCAALRTLWNAVTASDPGQLVMLTEAKGAEYALIKQALSSYLTRFPDHKTGLNEWDRALLESVGTGGTRSSNVVGTAIIGNKNSLDHVGDVYLFARLMQMSHSSLARPAVSFAGGAIRIDPGNVELTSFGKSLLAGAAHWVETNGIDLWLGGTHLSSTKKIWYREGNALLI